MTQTMLNVQLETNTQSNQILFPLDTIVHSVDKLDEFFGLVPGEKKQTLSNRSSSSSSSFSSSSASSTSTFLPNSEGGSWNPQSEVTLYVDESPDVVIITCEVTLPSKRHSLHLLCPLVSSTRLCFENCRRVCTTEDCSDNQNLFTVDCVEDVFVRDMYNIWKFRYIVNRHNLVIETGTWGCFHAGISTETVHLTAAVTTTTSSTTMPATRESTTTRRPNSWTLVRPAQFTSVTDEWIKLGNTSLITLVKKYNSTDSLLLNESKLIFVLFSSI